MRTALKLFSAVVLSCACAAGRADLVRVDLYGQVHGGDGSVSYSFTFDPAAYHSYAPPFYDQDFVYAIQPFDIFGPQTILGPRTVNTLDFFLGGDYMALYAGDALRPDPMYTELLLLQFGPGSCQNVPTEPLSGAAPTFVTKQCGTIGSSQYPETTYPEDLYIYEADFTVERSTVTPEPGSLVLLGSGLLAAGAVWRRRRV